MFIPRAQDLVESAHTLAARATYSYCTINGRYGYYRNCHRSGWSRFGRWIVAGILILLAIFLILALLCVMSRRRRKARNNTSYNAPLTNQPVAQQNYYGGAQPQPQTEYAPPAGPPPNQGYGYGGQQTGVAEPQNTYYPPK